MAVKRHITGTAHEGGNFTAGKIRLDHPENFSVYLSKTAWTFWLLCDKVQKSRLRIVISFSVDSILGVKYDLILVLRSQFFEY